MKYNGKNYDLPNKTLAIVKEMADFQTLEREYVGVNDVENVVNSQYDFICKMLGTDVVNSILGDSLEEVDVDEILDISLCIVEAYDSKAKKKRQEKAQKELSAMMNNSNLNKLTNIVDKVENAKL